MTVKSATPSSWDVNRVRSGLLNNPSSEQDTRQLLRAFLNGKDHINIIQQLVAGEQAKLLEIIDQVSAAPPSPSPLRVTKRVGPDVDSPDCHEQAAPIDLTRSTKFVIALGDISSDILRLPNSIGSLQGLEKRGETAIASGGTTDIWRGTWNDQQVALKAFRLICPQDFQGAKRVLWKQVPIWKRLVHENVLPFHGVDTSIFQLALVYDWGHNGNISQYLESNPNASRSELVSIRLRSVRSAFPDHIAPSCCKLPEGSNTSTPATSSTET